MNFFVIILLIFLCIIAIFYLMMRYINNKRSDIFLTTPQLYHYLINDIDNFYNKLKPIDLLLRNVENVKEYKENIYDSLGNLYISDYDEFYKKNIQAYDHHYTYDIYDDDIEPHL